AELNLWYLDDATIRDSSEVMLADLDVQKMAAEVGLTLNSSKSEMAIVGARSVDEEQSVIELIKKRAPGITVMQEEDILLGFSVLSFNTTTIIAEAQKFWETSCHAEEVPAGPVCCIQSVWEAPVIQHTLFDFGISSNTAEEKARFLAAQYMTSGCWLNAPPSPHVHPVLENLLVVPDPTARDQMDKHWFHGQDEDVSCRDTFAPSHLSGTSKTAGYAAARERGREEKNTPNC
ncbi:hypothetical protein ILUMI_14793, partial [Ignelater luminosus]